jgi:hypothetical protein
MFRKADAYQHGGKLELVQADDEDGDLRLGGILTFS